MLNFALFVGPLQIFFAKVLGSKFLHLNTWNENRERKVEINATVMSILNHNVASAATCDHSSVFISPEVLQFQAIA